MFQEGIAVQITLHSVPVNKERNAILLRICTLYEYIFGEENKDKNARIGLCLHSTTPGLQARFARQYVCDFGLYAKVYLSALAVNDSTVCIC